MSTDSIPCGNSSFSFADAFAENVGDILGEDFLEELRGVRSPASMNFSASTSSRRARSNQQVFIAKLAFHPHKISKKLQKKSKD